MKILRFCRTALLATAFAILFISAPVFGQSSDTDSSYSLTIRANVEKTQVFINAIQQRASTPLRVTLKGGRYKITVRAEGYEDYETTITLNRNTTITANLVPARHSLTVNSNVENSSVYINNSLRGVSPSRVELSPGRYTITVRARGYGDYTVTIDLDRNTAVNALLKRTKFNLSVNSNVEDAEISINGEKVGNVPLRMELESGEYALLVEAPGHYAFERALQLNQDETINAELEPIDFTLTIGSNVEGAVVFINDEMAGDTPLQIKLPPAIYALRIEAEDFYELSREVNLNQNRRLNITLKPATSMVNFVIPDHFLNHRIENPIGQFRLFVDEERQEELGFKVLEGMRLIRIVTGGLSIEEEMEFKAGKTYLLVFGLILELKDPDEEEALGQLQ